MSLWNVWTALATGLLIGTSIGMLLTALLTISSRDESRQPPMSKNDAERLHASVRHGNDVATPPDSVDSPAETREPLHFH